MFSVTYLDRIFTSPVLQKKENKRTLTQRKKENNVLVAKQIISFWDNFLSAVNIRPERWKNISS